MYPQFLLNFRLPDEDLRREAMRDAVDSMWHLNLTERERNYLKLAKVILAEGPAR
ncbi:MAG: hypothetical protein AAGA58_10700 [Verrucomicrobiota bacterium]